MRRKVKRQPPPLDRALLRKARRLALRTAAVKQGDRAEILALIDDIQTVRKKLLAECARLDNEMKRASVRVVALRAYAQSAMAIRPRRH
jgi:hypothetical protein